MFIPLTLVLVSLAAPPAEDLNCLKPDVGASTLVYKEEVFQLVGFCMQIHRELGKGHDEVIYKDAFVVELTGRKFLFRGRRTTKSFIKALSCPISITLILWSGTKCSLKEKPCKSLMTHISNKS